MHSWHCREMNSGCWSWSYNTLATWCKELTHWKSPNAGKDWRQEEKGTIEDEMAGCHHRLNGHEFEQAPGVGDGQGSLACCSQWSRKELDTTEWLNWTEFRLQFFAVVSTHSLDLADKWKEQIFRVLLNFLHFQVQRICYISKKK